MIQEITAVVESQAPWMVLTVLLIAFIIKLQNDKLCKVCDALDKLVLLYVEHDKQAKDIHDDTKSIHEWCIAAGNSLK